MKKIMKKLLNKETILYGIFGMLTSLLNIVLFQGLLLLEVEYKVANFVTLIVVKIAAYICNKNFVFKSKCANFIELCKEIWRFIIARGVTMLIDYFGLIVLVEFFELSKMPCKIFITVLVIVLNYVIGKSHVFKQESL